MVSNKPWFDRLLHETGDFFCFGIVGGSAFNMSPKGERFIRGLQAVRVNAPLCTSYCAVWGGLTSVFESSMKYVRQKDDPWTSILSDVAAAGLLKMRRGIGPSLSSSLIVSSTMELVEGYLVGQNRVASNLQSPQPNFEELHKKQKRGGIKELCYGYISVPIGPSIGGAPVADRHPPNKRAPGVHYGHPYGYAAFSGIKINGHPYGYTAFSGIKT